MDKKATETVQVTETEYDSQVNSSINQEASLIMECMEHIKEIKREKIK